MATTPVNGIYPPAPGLPQWPAYVPSNGWSGPRDANPQYKTTQTAIGPSPMPAPAPMPQQHPGQQFNAEAVRAMPGKFDPNFLQNLALFAAQNVMRPGGMLQFNPVAQGQGHGGLDQIGQAQGGGNAPVMGLPMTLLQQALGRAFPGQAPQNAPVSSVSPGAAMPQPQQQQQTQQPAAPAPAPIPNRGIAAPIPAQPAPAPSSPLPSSYQTKTTINQPATNQYYQAPVPSYQPRPLATTTRFNAA